MDKTVFVFNKFYTCLVKDLKKNEVLAERIKRNYKAIDKLSKEYVEFFISQFEEKFTEPNVKGMIVKEITLEEALEAVEEPDKAVVWNYYYILATLAAVTKEFQSNDGNEESNGVLADAVFNILNWKQKGENVDDEISTVLHDDVQVLLGKIKKVELKGDIPKPEAESSDNPFASMFSGMENSKICNLAQEISNDLDISNLKIDSPDDIMKMLDFSGSNNIMGDIIKKVSSKMHEKISTGELKQEELFGEAMSMMGKMNLGSMGGLFNNPMMSEMFKMAKKGKTQTKQDAFKKASSRERLRRKLDEKRKQQQQ
jgi:hypothetical protein